MAKRNCLHGLWNLTIKQVKTSKKIVVILDFCNEDKRRMFFISLNASKLYFNFKHVFDDTFFTTPHRNLCYF